MRILIMALFLCQAFGQEALLKSRKQVEYLNDLNSYPSTFQVETPKAEALMGQAEGVMAKYGLVIISRSSFAIQARHNNLVISVSRVDFPGGTSEIQVRVTRIKGISIVSKRGPLLVYSRAESPESTGKLESLAFSQINRLKIKSELRPHFRKAQPLAKLVVKFLHTNALYPSTNLAELVMDNLGIKLTEAPKGKKISSHKFGPDVSVFEIISNGLQAKNKGATQMYTSDQEYGFYKEKKKR